MFSRPEHPRLTIAALFAVLPYPPLYLSSPRLQENEALLNFLSILPLHLHRGAPIDSILRSCENNQRRPEGGG